MPMMICVGSAVWLVPSPVSAIMVGPPDNELVLVAPLCESVVAAGWIVVVSVWVCVDGCCGVCVMVEVDVKVALAFRALDGRGGVSLVR
jgi:hypothetical protein